MTALFSTLALLATASVSAISFANTTYKPAYIDKNGYCVVDIHPSQKLNMSNSTSSMPPVATIMSFVFLKQQEQSPISPSTMETVLFQAKATSCPTILSTMAVPKATSYSLQKKVIKWL